MGFPVINPFFQFFDNTGEPLAGGLLFTYEPTSSTKKTTYQDADLGTPNSNPIVLDSAGRCDIFLTDGEQYKFVLSPSTDTDPPTSPIRTVDKVKSPYSLTQAQIGLLFYPRSAAEIAAAVTPVNYFKSYGRTDRYATNTTPGTTDMTAAVQASLDQQANGGAKTIIVGNNKITSRLTVTTTEDFTVEGIEGAVLTSTAADPGSASGVLKIIGDNSTRLVCSDFIINHSGTGSTLSGILVSTLIARADFRNVEVTGARYYGCEVNATHQSHVNCSYSDNIHGGLLVYGGYWQLIGLRISNNGNGSDNTEGYGVELSGTGGLIVGGEFIDNDRYGIDARRANNFVVDGAYVYNSGLYGIYGVNEDSDKDFSNCKIINCRVDNNNRANSSHGIWLGGFGGSQTATPGEIALLNNTVKNVVVSGAGTGYGIYVSGGTGSFPPTRVNVSDNILEEIDGDYAINVSGTNDAQQVLVCRNQCKNTNEIFVVATNAATVKDNQFEFSGSLDRVIAVTADNVIVTDNISVGTISGGDGVEVTAATSQRIRGNRVGSFLVGSATYDPGSLADGAGATTTVTATGADLGDFAYASFSLDIQGISLTAWVSAADTVSVRFQNESGGVLDLSSGTLRVFVERIQG